MKSRCLLFFITTFLPGFLLSQEKLKSDGQIPVLGWYSIPAKESTLERYREMKDAGFTHSLSFFSKLEDLQKALDVADQAGMKLLATCPELKKEPEKTARQLFGLRIGATTGKGKDGPLL